MRIACISASQVPSNTANSIQMMKACHGLASLGHEVHLFVPGNQSFTWEELARHYGLRTSFEINGLPVQPRLKRYDFAWKAVREARRLQVDLLYTWVLQSAWLGTRQDIPVLLEVHDRPTGKLGRRMFGWFLHSNSPKRVLSITQTLANFLERDYQYHFLPGELVIGANGVDLEQYENLPDPVQARRLLRLPSQVTAGYTGHFYAGRGMEVLVQLAQRNPETNFLWVGGRPEDVLRWQERLKSLGVGNVLLTGFVDQEHLPLYQAAADILLMPYERSIAGSSGGNSVDICSPMKMFDYMAAGRAIITSDLPVIREVLNEQNALFCVPEAIDSWDGALKKLLQSPEIRSDLARQARQNIKQFTWSARASRALDGILTQG